MLNVHLCVCCRVGGGGFIYIYTTCVLYTCVCVMCASICLCTCLLVSCACILFACVCGSLYLYCKNGLNMVLQPVAMKSLSFGVL